MIVEPIPFPEYHVKPARQSSMFELAEPDTLVYEGNSGRIPIRAPHHYEGNVERWRRVFGGKNKVVILQGDSRYLIDRLKEAGMLVDGVVSIGSPPFEEQKRFSDTRHSEAMKNDQKFKPGVHPEPQRKKISISSPPYLETHVSGDMRVDRNKVGTGQGLAVDDGKNYANSKGQLGNDNPDTFWSASSLIIEQLSHLVSHSVWVTKNYVKDGKLVNFTAQWIACCEAHGFELVHHHKAYQLEEKGIKVDFEGETKAITKGGVSFFRGLVNKKHRDAGNDELVIEAEDVLCFVNRRFNGN